MLQYILFILDTKLFKLTCFIAYKYYIILSELPCMLIHNHIDVLWEDFSKTAIYMFMGSKIQHANTGLFIAEIL